MFPRLDVDFHLAPFVDARDHFGLAQARVRIGAPHFEKPREFWVRPVRWTGAEKTDHFFIIRPVELGADQLFLAIKTIAHFLDWDVEELPPGWGKGVVEGPKTSVKSSLNHLERYHRHPTLPMAARYSFYFGLNQFAPSLYALRGSETREFLWPINFGDPLAFSSGQWADWQAQEFHAFVSQQFDDSQSEMYLTWQWLQIPREQWFAAYVGRSEWSGFTELMRLVLINEFGHNKNLARQELEVEWHYGIRKLQTSTAAQWANGLLPGARSAGNTFEYSQRLDNWSKALRNYYEGLATQMPAPKFINAHIFYDHSISCSAPSHHEMLEARLQLHAWARAHLAPAEARRLIELDALN